MIFVLDNYDSFTYNLVQRLGEIDPAVQIEVRRNDQISLAEIEALAPERIIVSPGPCTPAEAGISVDVVRHFGPNVPLLGVCLGHQSIAVAYGARVVRADRLMHGKTSLIHHDGQDLFRGLPNPFEATRYHSLIVPEHSLPDELVATAWTRDEDHPPEVMGVRHRTHPVFGVQFHPESFLSPAGIQLLENFLAWSPELNVVGGVT
jgi:anthranilate synthase component 2